MKMPGRSSLSWTRSFRLENLGQNALAVVGNLCFTLFVVGVLIFTIIAATYQPEDPLFHPSTKITTFLTSKMNATFITDEYGLRTGEDFIKTNQSASDEVINVTFIAAPAVMANPNCQAEMVSPIDCTDPEIFQLMMRAAIEYFKDIHFYRFGKSVHGSNDSSCDMAWRFRPKEEKVLHFIRTIRVRKRKKNQKGAIMGPLIMTVVIALKNLYVEFVLADAKECDG